MPGALTVAVQQADFDVGALQSGLLGHGEGAAATFTGYVRAGSGAQAVTLLELEHYPGMTESSIRAILEEASERWPVLAASVVHRVGALRPGEQIVWVGVTSTHRDAAFAACEFVMDYLKTRAPFWKKEHGPGGNRWVEARASDERRAGRWLNGSPEQGAQQ